jgi:hypothetical protein
MGAWTLGSCSKSRLLHARVFASTYLVCYATKRPLPTTNLAYMSLRGVLRAMLAQRLVFV